MTETFQRRKSLSSEQAPSLLKLSPPCPCLDMIIDCIENECLEGSLREILLFVGWCCYWAMGPQEAQVLSWAARWAPALTGSERHHLNACAWPSLGSSLSSQNNCLYPVTLPKCLYSWGRWECWRIRSETTVIARLIWESRWSSFKPSAGNAGCV